MCKHHNKLRVRFHSSFNLLFRFCAFLWNKFKSQSDLLKSILNEIFFDFWSRQEAVGLRGQTNHPLLIIICFISVFFALILSTLYMTYKRTAYLGIPFIYRNISYALNESARNVDIELPSAIILNPSRSSQLPPVWALARAKKRNENGIIQTRPWMFTIQLSVMWNTRLA